MTTIAGFLATLAVSHLGGSALGGLLVRFGFLGFGTKLKIARHVLKVGKALRAAFNKQPTTHTHTHTHTQALPYVVMLPQCPIKVG